MTHPSDERPGPDAALVRRAARRAAVGIGLAVACAVLLVGVAAWVVARAELAERGGETSQEQQHDLRDALTVGALVVGAGAAAVVVGLVAGRWAVRPLADALAEQRRFVADASHELRTPVAVISTRAQLLLRRTPADDPRRPLVDELVADARVLDDVVGDLLVMGLVERGPLATEPTDLAALVRRTVASVAVGAPDRDVVVDAPPTWAECSPVAVRRAVTSLVDNALAHARRTVRVRVAAVPPARVVVEVVDDGTGFGPGADVAALLTRFHRGTSDDGRARFGLGLALVAEVAAAHGGRLVLDDAEEGGGRARLELPAAAPVEGDER